MVLQGPETISMTLQAAMLWRVVLAAALGAALGLERSLAGKHAGMRTYALVSSGSAMFVILGALASTELFSGFSGINPIQVASNVVLGVGFLGSGLSVFRGEHPVELTTAAGLWVSAGIGMAAGFGFPLLACGMGVIAVLILSLLLNIENSMRSRYSTRETVEVKAAQVAKRAPAKRRAPKPRQIKVTEVQ